MRQAFGGSGEPALLAVVAVQSVGAPADIVSSELDALTAALRKSSSRLSVAAQTSDGRGEVTAEHTAKATATDVKADIAQLGL